MGRRDMRLPAPVLILPSWLSRHQVELVNGHGQVSRTHRNMEENSTGADHDRQRQRGSPPSDQEDTMTRANTQTARRSPNVRSKLGGRCVLPIRGVRGRSTRPGPRLRHRRLGDRQLTALVGARRAAAPSWILGHMLPFFHVEKGLPRPAPSTVTGWRRRSVVVYDPDVRTIRSTKAVAGA